MLCCAIADMRIRQAMEYEDNENCSLGMEMAQWSSDLLFEKPFLHLMLSL